MMSASVEWGLFSDEGLVEGDLWSESAASGALATYDEDDALYVANVCPECRDGEMGYCECNEEDADDDDD